MLLLLLLSYDVINHTVGNNSKRLPFSLADLNRNETVFYYREEQRSITEGKIPFLLIFLIMFRNFRDKKT